METGTEQHVTFGGAAVTLAGTLGLPRRGVGSTPGLVLIGGSGPTDRDNGAYFRPLRRHLVRAGFAVLSYDKRGVGGSSGDWRAAGMDDLAADAVAALRFLRGRSGIASGATGFFGHSEGGWVALRAAARREDLAWVVTNSCPGTSPAVQERFALAHHLRALHGQGHPEAHRTLALYDALVAAGSRDEDFAAACRLVRAAGDPAGLAPFWSGVDDAVWSFLKRKQHHDPTADLASLRCPHLALFGGADEVTPVGESLRVFASAVGDPARPRRATLTAEVFPGGDHRIQVGPFGALAPGYLETVTDWLTARLPPADGRSSTL